MLKTIAKSLKISFSSQFLNVSFSSQLSLFTKLLYYMDFWENIEFIPKLIRNFNPKVIIYFYGLGYCWQRPVIISIINRDTMISHKIEIMCSFGWSKGHVIMKFVVIVISLVEFDICSLVPEYASWLHNKWDL